MRARSLLDDAGLRPDLFRWNGRMEPARLAAWLDSDRWLGRCPHDLLAFWQETGGGDLFETETILGPGNDRGDNIATVNREMRSRGMPHSLVVFAIGWLTSAVDTTAGDYVVLEPSEFRVLQRFGSLDDWYCSTLRQEFGDRYGLPTQP